ncbi:MAG: NAD(P)-dependent oxidoreductase [Sciscionella sp.]
MRITVFGASGGTGKMLVRLALDESHEVTAVVRDPAKLGTRHEKLSVVRADVLDSAAIKPAVKEADAVFSALGAKQRSDPARICSRGIHSILEAMSAVGTRRLLCISAAPVAEATEGDRLLYRALARPLLRAILREAYADMATMEREVTASDTEWTVFRPPKLIDKPSGGGYRTAYNANVAGGYRIARADLATEMLARVSDPASYGKFIGIGY